MIETPGAAELARLRAAVVALEAANTALSERIAAITEAHRGDLASRDALIAAQTDRIAELERQVGRDSSHSSKPPSSDSPYKKKGRDRSLRENSGRRPGKQPGASSATLPNDLAFRDLAGVRGSGVGFGG